MADRDGTRIGADAAWLLETEQTDQRSRRAPLSRGEIVGAALRIIDEAGLDALSMRRLGDELGVRAMAMYRHVRDKSQLLDLVIEGVLRDIESPVMTGDWRADAAAIARATRRGMVRHRHAITLLASRPWVGPVGLTGMDATIGVFRRGGFSDADAVRAQFALGNFVMGFCSWEASNLGAASEDPAARATLLARYRDFVAGLPADRFPNLAAVGPSLVSGTLDERFDAGLALFLDGIACGDRRGRGPAAGRDAPAGGVPPRPRPRAPLGGPLPSSEMSADPRSAPDVRGDPAAASTSAAGAPAGGQPALPSNGDLARIFHEIGDLLEIKGELVFKTNAYHRAADAIAHSPHEIARAYRAGSPPAIPGVGKAISDKIVEIVATGGLRFLDRVRSEVPPTLQEILAIPGVGPKTVKLLWERFGITDLAGLSAALRAGAVVPGAGFSERTIEGLKGAVEALDRRTSRMTLGLAEGIVGSLAELLADTPGLRSIQPAGSFRRRRDTIGDLDLLAETDDPAALVARFTGLAAVEGILGAGSSKASVRMLRGPQVDLMIMPPGTAGTHLVHFTGSKDHNIRLRGIARDRGWSLSEKGFLRLGDDGEPAAGADAELRTFETEAEVYGFLDLPFIEPELREDRGEIEAARAGRLPQLISEADLRGDCHAHTEWSDGVHTIEQMAETARARGFAYLVLTDHSQSLAVANGLTPARVMEQRALIGQLNARFAREEDAGSAPGVTPPEGFRVLHGCELEIRADGRLDFDDELLAIFDVVVGALHVGRRQPREQLTSRVLRAIASPHVDVIAHPAGRMLGDRERPDLDLAWDEVYTAAAANGTLLEIDGSDHRLDLAPERARRAVELGCRLTIDSDAHRTDELAGIRWGVAQARRAWIEPADVANTWSRADLLAWCAAKPERLA